jgi:hypothetical protein
VIAAPTNAQLTQVLWAALTGAVRSAERHGRYLGGRWEGLTWTLGDGWTVEGWGQGSIESKSGRHAPDLLAIVDEASGCKPGVMEAIDSLNPSRYLYLGNPLWPEGKFFDLCQRGESDPNVNVITIPSLESPHIDLVRSPWGMADRTWLELQESEYGSDSLWWQSHVLAKFPGEMAQALLPMQWLADAGRLIAVRTGPVRLGVDVALGRGDGDEAAIVARDDGGVIGGWLSNRWKLEELAAQAVAKVREFKVRPEHVTYDATGVGADFGARLRAAGLNGCKGYMGANSGGDRYANLRAACGWALRRRLDPNRSVRTADAGNPAAPGVYVPQRPFAIPGDLLRRYRAELQGLRYSLGPKGEIVLEAGATFRARLKRSPNFLDALLMTFAFPHS